jgi:hypothetical protein
MNVFFSALASALIGDNPSKCQRLAGLSAMRLGKQLFFLFCLHALVYRDAHAMMQRGSTKRVVDELRPSKRFKPDVAELFLSNTVSADRAQRLYNNAYQVDKEDIKPFVKEYKATNQKNVARDLRRKLRKGSKWPTPYYAEIMCFNPKTQMNERMRVPMWLPHELVSALHDKNGIHLLNQDGYDLASLAHLAKVAEHLRVSPSNLVGVGLWCDGTPFNRNRSKSLEVISMNFPGVGTDLRLPLLAIPKDFLATHTTYDDIFEVLAWSFQCLYKGRHPRCRHDGSAFQRTDAKRTKKIDKDLVQGALVEIRGDWAAYKECFRLPGWRDKAGCCWMCDMLTSNLSDVSSGADWKKPEHRLRHEDVLQRCLDKGLPISKIFAIPHCNTSLFKVDWLHCVDMGVAADFLGSLFELVCSTMPGENKDERCKQLHSRMHAYYKTNGCQAPLRELKPSMLRKQDDKKHHFPKLRGKAAEVRELIPFAKQIAADLSDSVEHESAKVAAAYLLECYDNLHKARFNKESLRKAATKFGLQYVGLHQLAKSQNIARWALKPKFHLFQELCHGAQSSPAKYYTYRDESFGGFVSSMCERRGGKYSPHGVGQSFLDKFAGLNQIPQL